MKYAVTFAAVCAVNGSSNVDVIVIRLSEVDPTIIKLLLVAALIYMGHDQAIALI